MTSGHLVSARYSLFGENNRLCSALSDETVVARCLASNEVRGMCTGVEEKKRERKRSDRVGERGGRGQCGLRNKREDEENGKKAMKMRRNCIRSLVSSVVRV